MEIQIFDLDREDIEHPEVETHFQQVSVGKFP